jgi:hypothetical protein
VERDHEPRCAVQRGPGVRLADLGRILGRDARLLLADVGPRFVALDVRADEVARDLVVQRAAPVPNSTARRATVRALTFARSAALRSLFAFTSA